MFPKAFFERSSIQVARELLGVRLVRMEGGQRLAGIIVETEAYQGEEDLACHAKAGRTARTAVMYGPGGYAFVYFTYGAHWMLNVVTEPPNQPAAVLLRGIWPVEGLEQMAAHRPPPPRRPGATPNQGWTDGPGKLTQALAITGAFNGLNLCDPSGELFIETGQPIPDRQVVIGARVGINNVPEPWRSKPWRFLVPNHTLSLS
ncbi:MAG: DNA-3-methyladenine glycosylase [Anaerolineaceae bacterium]|nr:DNA-3-methyladenine glycosylase [Anaerolineaceae bacterium]